MDTKTYEAFSKMDVTGKAVFLTPKETRNGYKDFSLGYAYDGYLTQLNGDIQLAITMRVQDYLQIVSSVLPHTSTDAARPNLSQIEVRQVGDNIRFASTDGFTMVLKNLPIKNIGWFVDKAVLHLPRVFFLPDMVKRVKKSDSQIVYFWISFKSESEHVYFNYGTDTIYQAWRTDYYPDLNQIAYMQRKDAKVHFDKYPLQLLIKAALAFDPNAIIVFERDALIYNTVSITYGKIYAKSDGVLNNFFAVPDEYLQGQTENFDVYLRTGFRADYLKRCLEALSETDYTAHIVFDKNRATPINPDSYPSPIWIESGDTLILCMPVILPKKEGEA